MSEAARTLSIVVLSWNTSELLRACLASLRRLPPDLDHEVIVVDNASADGSADMVAREFPEARLIRNEQNLGYAAGNNAGIRASSGRHVLLLNSDTEVAPDAPGLLVSHLEQDPSCGAVGAQLLNPDGTIQRACMRFPNLAVLIGFDTWFGKRFPLKCALERYFYRDFDHASSREVEQPPAAALAVPRRVFDQVGLLDEDLFLFFNDVDLCRRLRAAGFRIHFLAEARVLHHGGASTRGYREFALEWHRNRARYYRRAYGRLACRLAKVMTAWRALEEWWRTAHRMTDRAERRAASAEIRSVLAAVWRDAR